MPVCRLVGLRQTAQVGFDAVVLAGGRASRLGGADKAAVEVGGETLLEHALAVVEGADRVVVVGDERPTYRPVLWTREQPAYGGPVAATYAGLDELVRSDTQSGGSLLVLAVDMPGVSSTTVGRLLEAMEGHDGAVLSAEGRRHLAFAVQPPALQRARPEDADGVAMRALWASLDLVDVPARAEEARDVDSWSDLTAYPGSDPRY